MICVSKVRILNSVFLPAVKTAGSDFQNRPSPISVSWKQVHAGGLWENSPRLHSRVSIAMFLERRESADLRFLTLEEWGW
jgi:hypothetical protein